MIMQTVWVDRSYSSWYTWSIL